MIKILFLFSGIALFSISASSQTHFGLRGGLNFANQVKTVSFPTVPVNEQDTKTFVGYQLGMFAKTSIAGNFTFATEINFSVIGSNMTIMSADLVNYNTTEKLGYLEIPLMLQYSINKFYMGLGPSVGFKLFSKFKHFENRTFDISGYKTIDAAANFLAGLNVSKKIDLNVRYSNGLMNLYPDGGFAETKNNFLNVSILYTLK